mgnify:CR=1 FL=1
MKRPLSIAACLLVPTSFASAQILLQEFHGEAAEARLGGNFDFIGDLTGDGVSDFIAGFPDDDTAGPDRGRVAVYSGADGSLFRQYFSDGDYERIGESVRAAGDIDADGVPDYISGSTSEYGGRGAVRVWSGAIGTLLYYVRGDTIGIDFAHAVDRAGDVDGDGHGDFVVGEPGWEEGGGLTDLGRVLVYSGANGQVIRTIVNAQFESSNGRRFGTLVRWVGDVNGDGFDDIFAGSYIAPTPCGNCRTGFVSVNSGADGSVIYQRRGWYDGHVGESELIGPSMAGLGDIDGDGKDEYLIGMDIGYECAAAFLLGASGQEIRSFQWEDCVDFDGSGTTILLGDAANLGDLDGDGMADAILDVGEPDKADIRSGATGALIFALAGLELEGFKQAFSACGDVNGDGVPDIAVGLPLADDAWTNAGRIEIWSGTPCGYSEIFCVGAPNSVGPGARLRFEGSANHSAADLVLAVDGGPPNQFGLFYFGPDPIQIPYGDGYRCAGGGFHRLGLRPFDATGSASLAVDYSSSKAALLQPGTTWSFQFLYRDPNGPLGSGFNGSDGLTLQFCL